MQLAGPRACSCPRHAQARFPLLRFRLEEAVRSDKHAPAACTAFAVTAVPAVLAGVTAGIPAAHGGQQTEPGAGVVRQPRPARAPRPDHLPVGSAFLHDPVW
jgi:hypothetical protein